MVYLRDGFLPWLQIHTSDEDETFRLVLKSKVLYKRQLSENKASKQGNKSDLITKQLNETISNIIKEYNCKYISCSAKQDINVKEAFDLLVDECYNNNLNKSENEN